MTTRQEQVMGWFETYKGQHGFAPSLTEAAKAFGVSAEAISKTLLRGGAARERGKARTIVTPTEMSLGVGITYTPKQHTVMGFIKQGLKVKEMAAKMNVTSSAISQLLTVLVEKGAIERGEKWQAHKGAAG
jgi:predicted transcriptional regulator